MNSIIRECVNMCTIEEIVDTCNKCLEKIDGSIVELWQGKGTNIQELLATVGTVSEIMAEGYEFLKKNHIDFPLEFIKRAVINLNTAVKERDDYMLADNLYYEWKEIIMVFCETITICICEEQPI